jgi:hypothetical protein
MKLRNLLLGAAALVALGTGSAFAASQFFPKSSIIADAVAAWNPNTEYETVAASQTDQVMGATGGAGDYLDHCTLMVATAATAATVIEDGASTAIYSFANSPGGGIGVYDIQVHAKSVTGGWTITTGAGVSVICVGDFL